MSKREIKRSFCQPEEEGFLKMKVGKAYQWMRFILKEGLLYLFNGSTISSSCANE